MKHLLLTLYILSFFLCFYCSDSSDNNSKPLKESSVQNEYFQIPKSFSGKIAFQSNKDGDNEIYLLSKEGIKKLTDNTYQDEYPLFDPSGKWIIYQANPKGGNNYDIFMMKPDGSYNQQIIATLNKESEATFCSKDLETIAYTYNDNEIHIYNRNKNKDEVIKNIKGMRCILPIWSPANNYITYTGKRLIGWDVALYKNENEGSLFLTDGGKSCRARWSHKGDKLAFVSQRADGKGDIWIMNADGSNQQRITTDDKTYEYYPAWSPDDKFIVYSSSTDKKRGNWSLWIIEINTKEKWKIYDSSAQDVFPTWSE